MSERKGQPSPPLEARGPATRESDRAKFAYGRNRKQPQRYHISDGVQALAIALSPLWLAILLAIYLRGAQ